MDLKIITSEDVSALEPGRRYIALPADDLVSAVAGLLAKQAASGLSSGAANRTASAPPIKAPRAEAMAQAPVAAAHNAVSGDQAELTSDQSASADRMLAFVSDNPGCAAAFIIAASKLPKSAADKLLLDLRKSKKLDTVGQKRGMRYYPAGVARTS